MNDRTYETYSEARTEAERISGHVRCVHYDTRYEYVVYPGKDPRALEEVPVGKIIAREKKGVDTKSWPSLSKKS